MYRLNKMPRHIVVAGSAWVSRIISAFIQLISVRVLLTYLGTEQYAVFAIVTSLSGWFMLAEFGIGPSLQNFISEARAKEKEYDEILKAVIPLIILIFIVSIIILIIISNPLQRFLLRETGNVVKSQSFYLVASVGAIYIVTALSGISYRVLYAQQKGYLSNIYPAAANIISMVGLVLLGRISYAGNGTGLFLALLVYTLPPAIAAIVSFYNVFKKIGRNFLNIDWTLVKLIFNRSYKFGGFAIMSAGVLQIDYIVMSQTLTNTDITRYNIISKVFFLIFFVYSAILMAIWPNCSEMFSKNEWDVANKLVRKILLWGIAIIILGTSIFTLTSDIVANVFSSEETISLPTTGICLFGFLYILRVWTDIFAMVLMSMNDMKVFWVFTPIQALISFVTQWGLSKVFGLNGIIIGLCISFILTSVWVLPARYRSIINSMKLRL